MTERENQEKSKSEREMAWFCIRSQPKRDHMAAANLRQLKGVEVFNPRLRRRRPNRRGLVWVTESLFPNYFFARFQLNPMLDTVKYTPSVNKVVHFGLHYPAIPDPVIDELKQNFDGTEMTALPTDLQQGDEVTIKEKAFYGLQAVVLRTMPAQQRVQVLIEILGQTATVELCMRSVVFESRNHHRPVLEVSVPQNPRGLF